jgi:hypothetical protein
MKTTLFRVEASDGEGPYRGGSIGLFALMGDRQFHEDYLHPTPQEEHLDIHYGRDVCAFKSFGDCLEWFGRSVLDLLERNGYHVYQYSVCPEYVKVGKHQVIVDKNKLDMEHRLVYE